MAYLEPQSINSVAKRLKLSVHQLRRWELLFGLEVRRGKGQQRQYRTQDLRVLERIKELVDQGWPTSQISQQLETEGLMVPKLIGLPVSSRNSEALVESIISVRTFCERRLGEIGQQLGEIRQILISLSLKQQMTDAAYSPWQPVAPSFPAITKEETPVPIVVAPPVLEQVHELMSPQDVSTTVSIGPTGSVTPEITDQNYLTVLGKTLDLVGWSDGQADEYSLKNYGVSVWLDLGRSDTEKFIEYLRSLSASVTDMTEANTAPAQDILSIDILDDEQQVSAGTAVDQAGAYVVPLDLNIASLSSGNSLGTSVDL